MSSQAKYNLLLIHDDGATRSFRVSRAAIRCVLIILALLPILSGAGLWAGWKAWERGQAWDEEEQVLQREMAALRVQLTRLSNIEALIRLSEAGPLPGEPGALPLAVAGNAEAPGTSSGTSPGAGPGAVSPPASDASAPGLQPGVQPGAQAGVPPAGPGVANSAVASGAVVPSADRSVAGSAPAVQPGDSAQTSGAGEVVNPDLAVIDKGVVSLNGVSARLGDDRRLRIRLDLHNAAGRQVSGKIGYYLVTADGHRTPLPSTDSSFRISRLKKFVTSSLLPDTFANLTNASLLVEVTSDDGTCLFRQLYPVSD